MSPITCQKSNSVATTAHVSCLSTQPERANVYITFQFSIIKSQNFVFCFPRILYPKQRLQNPSDVIGIQLLHVITFNMHLETVKYSRHGHKTQPGIRWEEFTHTRHIRNCTNSSFLVANIHVMCDDDMYRPSFSFAIYHLGIPYEKNERAS